ncbi:HET-domain-containing protein, partial [Ophiobolus disseminans]
MGLTAGSKLVGYVHIHRHNGPLVGLSKELVERAKELVETPELDMKLLRGWIETCEIMHGETCNKPMTLRGANTIEILLIDVLEHKVVFSDTSTRYLALSYVWGRAPVFMTTMDTLTDVLQPGFLDDKLSQVVADAMRVVEGLKERYLWVDTICIVQDDPDHKVAQIQNMDIIYGRSVATIAAASGTCSGDPLPGVSPSTRHPPSYVEPSPEATFVSQAPALYKFTSDSIYESRAWT